MVVAGYSPSVRLLEAAACGTPIISEDWPGPERVSVAGPRDSHRAELARRAPPSEESARSGARAHRRVCKAPRALVAHVVASRDGSGALRRAGVGRSARRVAASDGRGPPCIMRGRPVYAWRAQRINVAKFGGFPNISSPILKSFGPMPAAPLPGITPLLCIGWFQCKLKPFRKRSRTGESEPNSRHTPRNRREPATLPIFPSSAPVSLQGVWTQTSRGCGLPNGPIL